MTSADLDVDVVIPCWGTYSRSLQSCIRSVHGASSIIVVGDDAAAAVAGLEDVRFVRLLGPVRVGEARHVGMLASTASAICFLDADDRLLPGALTTMASVLAQDDDVVAVGGQMVRRSAPGSWPPRWRARLACTRWGAVVLLWRNSLPAVGSCVVRRRAVGDEQLFPDLLDEDWHAAITVRTLGTYVLLDRALLDYAVDEGSLSRRGRDARAFADSQDRLISTALAHLTRDQAWWRLADVVVAPFRRAHRALVVRRWSAVPPR